MKVKVYIVGSILKPLRLNLKKVNDLQELFERDDYENDSGLVDWENDSGLRDIENFIRETFKMSYTPRVMSVESVGPKMVKIRFCLSENPELIIEKA